MIRRLLRRLLLPLFRWLYLTPAGERVEFVVSRDAYGIRMDVASETASERYCVLSIRLAASSAAKLSRHLGRASYDHLEGPDLPEGDYETY